MRDNEGDLFAARNSIKVKCVQVAKHKLLYRANGSTGRERESPIFSLKGEKNTSNVISQKRVCGDSEVLVMCEFTTDQLSLMSPCSPV